MKGRYIFLEATDEEKQQALILEKNLDGPRKIFWRLNEILPDNPHKKRFEVYHEDLVKFNQKINLVSKNSIYDADVLHFLDSYLASEQILEDTDSDIIYDFGSGNGFPGLIMAILDQNRKFVLMDNDNRKLEFLKYMTTKLALKNVAVHNQDVGKVLGNGIQTAVSRGFASITKSCLLTRKAFAVGGTYYHLKGPLWSNEVADMPSQLLSVWKPEHIHTYKLSNGLGERHIVKTTCFSL